MGRSKGDHPEIGIGGLVRQEMIRGRLSAVGHLGEMTLSADPVVGVHRRGAWRTVHEHLTLLVARVALRGRASHHGKMAEEESSKELPWIEDALGVDGTFD